MIDNELFEDGFDLDGTEVLAALANIDPNAKQSDSPPPPVDGVYSVKVTAAPITKDGHPYKGKIVVPFVEKTQKGEPTSTLKPSKDGAQNATLFVNVAILGPEGNVITRRPLYLSSMVGNNGTSDVIALAKAFGFIEGDDKASFLASIKQFITDNAEDIKASSDVRFITANLQWLLAEAVGAQLVRAGEGGIVTTAVLQSTLMQDTGKKDSRGYAEWKRFLTGSTAIQEKGMWKGGVQQDSDGKSYRIELEITDFGTPLES